jgi:GTP-binding protein
MTQCPVIALIGRPNVGKSTLFNRLVGQKLALVDDRPGVTRDRREGQAQLSGNPAIVIDTAGLEDVHDDSLEARMRAQTEEAIAASDLSLFLIDARAGVTPLDAHFASLLRKSGSKVILVANKAEGRAGEAGFYDAFQLGLGEPVAISAEHGENMAELYLEIENRLEASGFFQQKWEDESASAEAVLQDLASDEDEAEAGDDEPLHTLDKPHRVAIMGRPNAGKSTLLNALLGQARVLTGPEAGITRDTIAVDFQYFDRPYKLFDTAGMRRKSRIQDKLEKLSVSDALRAIIFSETVILLFDATQAFEKQDLHLAALVEREGRALVIGLNKWDLVSDKQKTLEEMQYKLDKLLPQLKGVPLVPLSGLKGQGLDRLMRAVEKVDKIWNKRVSTAALNRWLDDILIHHPPPAVAGRRLKIRYLTQIKTRPPTFAIFCTRPEAFPTSYKRYLANSLRETFQLQGVPLRITMRAGENPYAGRARKRGQ